MGRKHYDNKNDLIREIKRTRLLAEQNTDIAFASQMILSLYVLHNTFGFGQERCERYVQAIQEADNNDLQHMRKYLLDKIGFCVELPNETIHATGEYNEKRYEL